MSATAHSAAGQAAGYEYQRQLSLVLLAEAVRRDPEAAVRLEAVEDVDLVSDNDKIARHVQAKHHLDDYTLTDRSPELWATLNVWMDLAQDVGRAPMPALQLVTTSIVAEDAGVASLGPEERDVQRALDRLDAVAREQGAASTRTTRRRFLGLSRAGQLRLLRAITILDASERVTDIDGRLRVALGMVVPRDHADAFLERVKGWWVTRSVELLAGEREAVSGDELYRYCDSIRDDFRSGGLAVTEELREDPTGDIKTPLLSRTFVRQLELVHAPEPALDLAVRHYYRAYAQRGRWSRDIDDLDEDIRAYERTLVDEWDTAFVALCVRASLEPTRRTREGLEFAMTFGEATRARLRGVDEHVLCRGTLHGLADDLTIGWHPDFRDYSEELLRRDE